MTLEEIRSDVQRCLEIEDSGDPCYHCRQKQFLLDQIKLFEDVIAAMAPGPGVAVSDPEGWGMVERQKPFDPKHNYDLKCARPGCGHTYYRHFDTHAEMSPVGCKYCSCRAFIEPEIQPMVEVPRCVRCHEPISVEGDAGRCLSCT